MPSYIEEGRTPDLYNYQTRQIILERMKLGLEVHMDLGMMQHMNFDMQVLDMGRTLAMRVEREIAARKIDTKKVEVTTSVSYPANWIEHLKWDFKHILPNWFLEKYPIKRKTVKNTKSETINVMEYHPEVVMRDERQAFVTLEVVPSEYRNFGSHS